MLYRLLWFLAGYWPVGIITYRQARRLAEDVHRWREIATNRNRYPVNNLEDRRESTVYGNCASQIETTLGRRRLLKWQRKWGSGCF